MYWWHFEIINTCWREGHEWSSHLESPTLSVDLHVKVKFSFHTRLKWKTSRPSQWFCENRFFHKQVQMCFLGRDALIPVYQSAVIWSLHPSSLPLWLISSHHHDALSTGLGRDAHNWPHKVVRTSSWTPNRSHQDWRRRWGTPPKFSCPTNIWGGRWAYPKWFFFSLCLTSVNSPIYIHLRS